MNAFLQTSLFTPRRRRGKQTRLPHRAQLRLEALEDRLVPAITDMTGVAALFPRHSGPTMLYLNFDGNTAQGVSPFKATTGNLTRDIHEIIFRVSQVFAPFDVEVVRSYGNGNASYGNGNTTIFIGDMSGNGTGGSNVAYAYTPWSSMDMPGSVRGVTHQPNSDTFDIAFVDPISGRSSPLTRIVTYSSWSNTTIARAAAHEAGHTFGLAHVVSSPNQETMSYDAANVRFFNVTHNITTLNNNGTSTAPDPNLQPWWHEMTEVFGNEIPYPNQVVTQNSFTFLQTVLGARTTSGDLANLADRSAADASYVDGGMWNTYAGFNLTAYIQRAGDFDVYGLYTATARTLQIDVRQISGSTVDPIVMVFDGAGLNLLAFNDDGGGFPHSRLIFAAAAGQSYRIVVGSYGAASSGGYQITLANYFTIVGPINVQASSLTYATVSGGGGLPASASAGAGSLTQSLDEAFATGATSNLLGNGLQRTLGLNLSQQLRGGRQGGLVASVAALLQVLAQEGGI